MRQPDEVRPGQQPNEVRPGTEARLAVDVRGALGARPGRLLRSEARLHTRSASEGIVSTVILVVEDEALIADDIERSLVRMGYTVPTVASSYDSAVEAATTLRPSLVLMDIKLKGTKDGIAAAHTIRERLDVPIVFLTSYSDAATLARASDVRPHGYVVKPFGERELRVAIEVALHKHNVEQVLAARERWYSTTMRSIGDGVIAVDDAQLVTFANRTAEELTGWSQEDALGRPLTEVFVLVDDQGGVIESSVGEALASGAVTHVAKATRLRRRNGELVSIDDSAAPILGPSERVQGAVLTFRDASRRIELEGRVARSERLAALGTLTAGLCHEISNPLTGVVANLSVGIEVLEAHVLGTGTGTAPISAALAALADALACSLRISDIVTEMRSFATPSKHRDVPVVVRDAIEKAIRLTGHIVRPLARVESQYLANPTVCGDEGGLVQVFVNLLVNAAQAMVAGDGRNHTIMVTVDANDEGDAIVTFADTGVGMEPAVLDRIFDPFFTTKSPCGGMGLGLAITNSIIEVHGGSIVVQSTPGTGTTFRIALPLAIVPERPSPSTHAG